jgi:hypothetical protein
LPSARIVKTKRKQNYLNQVGIARDEKHLVSSLIAAIQKTQGSKKYLMIASELDCFHVDSHTEIAGLATRNFKLRTWVAATCSSVSLVGEIFSCGDYRKQK